MSLVHVEQEKLFENYLGAQGTFKRVQHRVGSHLPREFKISMVYG